MFLLSFIISSSVAVISSCACCCCLLLRPGAHYKHSCWSGDLSRHNEGGSEVHAAFVREDLGFPAPSEAAVLLTFSLWSFFHHVWLIFGSLTFCLLRSMLFVMRWRRRSLFTEQQIFFYFLLWNGLIGVKLKYFLHISHTLISPDTQTRDVFWLFLLSSLRNVLPLLFPRAWILVAQEHFRFFLFVSLSIQEKVAEASINGTCAL